MKERIAQSKTFLPIRFEYAFFKWWPDAIFYKIYNLSFSEKGSFTGLIINRPKRWWTKRKYGLCLKPGFVRERSVGRIFILFSISFFIFLNTFLMILPAQYRQNTDRQENQNLRSYYWPDFIIHVILFTVKQLMRPTQM